MNTATGYLLEDGTPNVALLIETFNRCRPTVAGGIDWLNDVRFNRWPGQFTDGRKHHVANDPNGRARPWENASDCRPMVVDDVIGERKAMLTAAFWRAQMSPGASQTTEGGYAVALIEWLVFTKMLEQLLDEVELAADYVEHLGWCLLAPRWRRELGLKRYTLKMEQIVQAAQQAQQQREAQSQAGGAVAAAPLEMLPVLILDPTLEEQAAELMQGWYDTYVQATVPADMRERVPRTTKAQARKAVRELREKGEATVALPYLCANEPGIEALKPWEEVVVPPEATKAELVFHIEPISETDLRARVLSMGYDAAWVEEAVKNKEKWDATLPVGNPVGVSGLLAGGRTTGTATAELVGGQPAEGLVRIVHAVYKALDEYGVPAVYCTTFQPELGAGTGGAQRSARPTYALHELVEAVGNGLPYVPLMRERWSRSLVASRGVAEMAHTDQNLIKGHLDSTLDLASLAAQPPMNVYESPTGDTREYEFAPGKRNYCRQGREPQLMDLSNRGGMIDGMEAVLALTSRVDNRFGALAADVPPVRQQLKQENGVRRFVGGWTLAFKQVLCLYQKYGDDAEFARVTGADAGWLEARRDIPGLLTCVLDFDARELDPELEMKRVEAMNKIVLPTDALGVVNRAAWTADMTRSLLGPRRAKMLVRPVPEASQQLRDKAKAEVAQMFLGNQPNYLDDKDPTAAGLLQYTQEIVMQNPVYLGALNDEALVAVAGPQQAQMLAQQLGALRKPNERFSGLLVKWLENLKFIGVTQVANKQIGRIGVNPAEA